MLIRRAENIDIPKINDLLRQVCLVHHNGRPDLFKYGAQKYADEELIQIISMMKSLYLLLLMRIIRF